MSAKAVLVNDSEKISKLDMQIAVQCAPVLLGLKVANILITEKENEKRVVCIFKNTGISIYPLSKNHAKVYFLVYRQELLFAYLENRSVAEFLEELGYCGSCMAKIRQFAEKFSSYSGKKEEFPHEMGIFLGYPLVDVVGFIKNQGKNFLYAGYWKVYDNLNATRRTFRNYDRAGAVVQNMIISGISMQKFMQCGL